MEILEELYLPESWQDFFSYKKEQQNLTRQEQKRIQEYIEQKRYIPILDAIFKEEFLVPIPCKKEISKGGTGKKRTIYFYPEDFNIFLKMVTYKLYRYDFLFEKNCYAFRKDYGVRNAIQTIRQTKKLSEKYCLKVDIHDYFNSMDVDILLNKLQFLNERDFYLYKLFEQLLRADRAVVSSGKREWVIEEKRGAMAGTPSSPFFANLYLSDVDSYFAKREVEYFRYSDDILILCDDLGKLEELREQLCEKLEKRHLELNPSKFYMGRVSDTCEFLGFSFDGRGTIDLSENTKKKMKKKIKRKAHALRRWSDKKNLSYEKAAKGFIKAMNKKFFDSGREKEFSWSRFYFPLLTTVDGLREIDCYMQEYIRYCVTGRHYKGNYRIDYDRLKEWGYRNLVHEFYAGKKRQ